jgi:hypothetical protein
LVGWLFGRFAIGGYCFASRANRKTGKEGFGLSLAQKARFGQPRPMKILKDRHHVYSPGHSFMSEVDYVRLGCELARQGCELAKDLPRTFALAGL